MFWRFPLRVLLALFLFAVVFCGFGYWILTRTSLAEQQVNAWLDSFLSAQLPLAVTVGDIGGELWHELRIRNVQVDEIDAGELRPLLRLDSLRISYGWRNLLRSNWELDSAQIDGVRIRLRNDEEGHLRQPWRPAESGPSGPLSLPVARVSYLSVHDLEVLRFGADTARYVLRRLIGQAAIEEERIRASLDWSGFRAAGESCWMTSPQQCMRTWR